MVSYARSLSQERLGQLYKDVKRFADEGTEFNRVESTHENSPPELADIQYHNILLNGSYRSRIMLAGCLDHYVIMQLSGIYDDKPSEIILFWGEGPGYGEERLWPKEKAD